MLVDVHAHLTYPEIYKRLDGIIKRAEKNDFKAILDSGTSFESNKKVLENSKKYDIVKASLGLYPTEIKDLNKELEFVELNKKNIIAIGEVGMDFKEGKNYEEQKINFLRIIELSEKIKKPMIIHSRKAEKEILEILETSKSKKIILHCFSGNFKLINKAIDLGYSFSIPPVIVRLEHFKKLVEILPLNKILTESDTPFLSPYKNKINEPSFIKETIKEISKIKKITDEEIKKIIFMNFQKIFS